MQRLIVLAGTVGLLAALLVVSGATASGGTQYTGCLDDKGNLTSVAEGTEPLGNCGKKATPVTWNSEGPQGPSGPQGEPGSDGDDGAPGTRGEAGNPGADGQDGADGADGADGQPCSVADDGQGTITMICPDGSAVSWTGTIAQPEIVFAVAWIEETTVGSGYDPDVDTLIAKLIDGPLEDGVPGPYDLVITNQYPLDFIPSSVGQFLNTEHVVSAAFGDHNDCTLILDADEDLQIAFFSGVTSESYREDGGVYFGDSWHPDFARDTVIADAISNKISQPAIDLVDTNLVNAIDVDPSDDAFVEVELYRGCG